MKLIDLRRKRKEIESEISKPRTEPYYYGLSIDLDDIELDKLGINLSDYKPSDKLGLYCEVTVKSLSINKRNESKTDENMRLQITKMAVIDLPKNKIGKLRDYKKLLST